MITKQDVTIVIERVYPASLSEVWDLWVTKEGFESWWGPESFRAEVYALEAKLGGLLHYSMIAATPEMVENMKQMGQPPSHEVRTHFTRFEPMNGLTLTNVIDFLPGVETYKSDIDVQLEETSGGTRMTVTLHGMHDENFTRMQEEGFRSQLSKLDRRYLS